MILISLPHPTPDEGKRLLEFLNQWPGGRIHLRKPDFSEKEFLLTLESILKVVPHRFISVHQYHREAFKLGINNWHLTSKDVDLKQKNSQAEIMYSTSTHTIKEFNTLDSRYKYAFLSPIFPSISKLGYTPNVNWKKELKKRSNFCTKLVGLGGIRTEHWTELRDMGLDDIAILGSYWNE